ncbi:MAG: hypothetical protein CSA84_03660 [Actinomycetales bacterium]|nr:MAG: hypothetical protein CSA84_03660 [Actinomycetales bacterium]
MDGFDAVLVGVDLVGVGGVVDPVVMEPAQRHRFIDVRVSAGGFSMMLSSHSGLGFGWGEDAVVA